MVKYVRDFRSRVRNRVFDNRTETIIPVGSLVISQHVLTSAELPAKNARIARYKNTNILSLQGTPYEPRQRAGKHTVRENHQILLRLKQDRRCDRRHGINHHLQERNRVSGQAEAKLTHDMSERKIVSSRLLSRFGYLCH